MIEDVLLLLLIAALVALDLVSIAARAALMESSYARLITIKEGQETRVNRALELHSRLPRGKASVNLVLVLTRFGLAAWVISVISMKLPDAAWYIPVLALLGSALLLFIIEWWVQSSAEHDAEKSLMRFVPLLKLYMWIFLPLVSLSLAISHEPRGEMEHTSSVTESEFRTLVDAGQEEGVIEQGERRMIYSIIDLGDTLAREIMVPRIDMLTLEVNTPLGLAADALLSSGHSRVPVYEETVDNMKGLLYAKDLLRVWREGSQLDSLQSLLRPAYFIPEAKKVDKLLAEMQSQRIHMAIVVDEYGGVAGLVTLEDIIEEVLGEIMDEYDHAEEMPYQTLSNGEYVFLGRVDLNDFNEVMGSTLSKEEAETLGGYIYSRLGHVPVVGETVYADNLVLIVELVTARRIRKVRARWAPIEIEVDEEKHVDG